MTGVDDAVALLTAHMQKDEELLDGMVEELAREGGAGAVIFALLCIVEACFEQSSRMAVMLGLDDDKHRLLQRFAVELAATQ